MVGMPTHHVRLGRKRSLRFFRRSEGVRREDLGLALRQAFEHGDELRDHAVDHARFRLHRRAFPRRLAAGLPNMSQRCSSRRCRLESHDRNRVSDTPHACGNSELLSCTGPSRPASAFPTPLNRTSRPLPSRRIQDPRNTHDAIVCTTNRGKHH